MNLLTDPGCDVLLPAPFLTALAACCDLLNSIARQRMGQAAPDADPCRIQQLFVEYPRWLLFVLRDGRVITQRVREFDHVAGEKQAMYSIPCPRKRP